MNLFRHGYNITLNRIKDKVRVTEGKESLLLTVMVDPMRIVSGLNKVQIKLQSLTQDGKKPSEEELQEAAKFFASVMFGTEQAEQLMEFYDNSAQDVVSVCGTYFKERLAKKITKAQKKHG